MLGDKLWCIVCDVYVTPVITSEQVTITEKGMSLHILRTRLHARTVIADCTMRMKATRMP